MLQQTQVARVALAWERFLAVMGSPEQCALADRATVVRAWEGLGYHRRAVALHRAAAEIVERHDGNVPDSLPALLEGRDRQRAGPTAPAHGLSLDEVFYLPGNANPRAEEPDDE